MALKNLNFDVNEKDVRTILATLISLVLTRASDNVKKDATLLNEDFKTKGQKEILLILNKIQNHYQRAIQELDSLAPVVLPPDAEVLKDLSDLEEDGLGVDSGGEETVGISSDHLDE